MKYDMGLDITAGMAFDATAVAIASGNPLLVRLASDELAQAMNRYEKQEDGSYANSFLLFVASRGLTPEQVDAVLVPANLGTLTEFTTPQEEVAL